MYFDIMPLNQKVYKNKETEANILLHILISFIDLGRIFSIPTGTNEIRIILFE